MVTSLLISSNPALAILTNDDRYNSGYDHGCSDGKQGGHYYISGSGGASQHTQIFMNGYNDGYKACNSSSFSESYSPSTTQESTKKFNVQIVLDHAREEQYQVRVIVYGVSTLNKPTLDKPGLPIYSPQCIGECSIDAGIWSFTDSKVNNGDRIKACAVTVATRYIYCGYGNADKSHTDTIRIPIYATGVTKPANINFKAACDILAPALYQPCSSYVNPNGSLTKEGQRAYECIKGGFVWGLGTYLLTGGNFAAVAAALGILAPGFNCDNVVHLDLATGLLGGDLGKLNTLKSALGI